MIERLTVEDLPAALRLSTQAGWNQNEGDWRRMLAFGTCLGEKIEGRLVATASVVTFEERVSWIGMMLVDPAHRNRGLGSRMLARILGETRRGEVGLDATDLGRPLYLKAGFYDAAQVLRWTGVPKTKLNLKLPAVSVEDAIRLDREACGVDRSKLLRRLLSEPAVEAASLHGRGYAVLRPGRERFHVGPVVAAGADDFVALLGIAAGRDVFVDTFDVDSENSRALVDAGLRVQRQLTRMTLRSPRQLLMGPSVRAIVGFEWG